MNIFNKIYSNVLSIRDKMGGVSNFRRIEVDNAHIHKDKYMDLVYSRMLPAVGKSIIYLNDLMDINNLIHPSKVLSRSITYTLTDFSYIMKTSIMIFSNDVLVSPEKCKVQVSGTNMISLIIDEDISNVEIFVNKEITLYREYTGVNVLLPIHEDELNSYVSFKNGVITHIEPVLNDGKYYIPIDSTSNPIVILLSPHIKAYKITPKVNSGYNYIDYPFEGKMVKPENVYLFNENQTGYKNGIGYTILHDGVKVQDTNEKIVIYFIGENINNEYSDIRHHYNLYRDFVDEYLDNTLPSYMTNYYPYTPNLDDPSIFKSEMVKASKDFHNFYKSFLENTNHIGFTKFETIPIDSEKYKISMVGYNPYRLLFFKDGLNISPFNVNRFSNGKYEATFKAEGDIPQYLTAVDVGMQVKPYISPVIITDTSLSIGPSHRINKNSTIEIYETPRGGNTRLFNRLTNYTYTIDRNIINIEFDLMDVGKNIHVVVYDFNYVQSHPYNKSGLVKVPQWVSFSNKDNIHTFLNGRLMPNERVSLFRPFEYKIIKGDTVLVFDLDTDVQEGETITVFVSTMFEPVENNVSISDGDRIIELTDKSYPFSKKYNLVFIDGKLIEPDKITEIDSYRFSVESESINNMCIFRKKIDFEYTDEFSGIVDKWSEFMATLSEQQLEEFVGSLRAVHDNENSDREVYYDKRHLTEILYHYCLKGKRMLDEEDNENIAEEMSELLLPDGRLPISTIRPSYPRYKL